MKARPQQQIAALTLALALSAVLVGGTQAADRPDNRAGIRGVRAQSMDASDAHAGTSLTSPNDRGGALGPEQNAYAALLTRPRTRADNPLDLLARYQRMFNQAQPTRADNSLNVFARYQRMFNQAQPLVRAARASLAAAPSAPGSSWTDAAVVGGTVAGAVLALLGGTLLVVRRRGSLAV